MACSSFIKKVIAFIFVLLLISCEHSHQGLLEDKADWRSSSMDTVYSAEVAKRFSLPLSGASVLPQNIKAIGLEVAQNHKHYECTLHFYTNSSFRVYTPDDTRLYAWPNDAELAFVERLSDADQEIHSAAYAARRGYALFRSEAKDNFVSTLDINYVNYNYLPDLSLVSVKVNCELLKNEYLPASIWLQKAGSNSEPIGLVSIVSPPSELDAYKIELPMTLLQRNSLLINKVAESNLEHISNK